MPYKSDAQRRYFHTPAAREKGITPEMVNEFDQASKGKKLPEKVSEKKVYKRRKKSKTYKR